MSEPDHGHVRARRRPLAIATAVVVGGLGLGAGLYLAGGESQPAVTARQSAASQPQAAPSQPQAASQLGLPPSWTLPALPANPTAAQTAARNQALVALHEYADALGSQAGSVPAVSQLSDFVPPRLPPGANTAQIIANKKAGGALHSYEIAIVPPPPPTPIPIGLLEGTPGPSSNFIGNRYMWEGYVSGKFTVVWAGGKIPQTSYRDNSSLPGEVVVDVYPDSRQVANPTTADVSGTSTTSLYPAPAGITELQLISVSGNVANLKSTNGDTLTFNLVTHTYQVVN